jgi:hypothetical protein
MNANKWPALTAQANVDLPGIRCVAEICWLAGMPQDFKLKSLVAIGSPADSQAKGKFRFQGAVGGTACILQKLEDHDTAVEVDESYEHSRPLVSKSSPSNDLRHLEPAYRSKGRKAPVRVRRLK